MKYQSNFEDHGYYQVGEQKYFNRIQAIIESEKANQFPYFIFNDEKFNTYNWKVEPESTLSQLYANRAWQLRNDYDHLVLHYSGGWDSNNILETFIKNKIPLDEIFIRGPLSSVDKDIENTAAANMFAEAFFNAYPIAQYAKDTFYPNLKITVVDTTERNINFFKSSSWFDPENQPFTYFTPGIVSRADCDLLNPEWKAMSESGKKVGHVLGIDKPIINYENGEYHVKFLDKFMDTFFPKRVTTLDLPLYQEPFYWSPHTAELIIKQAHTVKNYIKQNNISPTILNELKGRDLHDFIGKIIYDRMIPIKFITDKAGVGAVYPWDSYFFNDTHSDHVKQWHKGMQQLELIIPDKWKHNGSVFNDLVGIWSKSYSIGS